MQAHEAIMNLKAKVDTLIVVSNDRLLHVLPEGAALLEAFTVADDVLRQGVFGICDIILKPGLINVDFADVKTIMSGAGRSILPFYITACLVFTLLWLFILCPCRHGSDRRGLRAGR
jgi:cell division protein FtsZ